MLEDELLAAPALGPAALRHMVQKLIPLKAQPGNSNHSNGAAVDFGTTFGGVYFKADSSTRKAWRKTWSHPWLVEQAESFGFKPLKSEDALEFRGTVASWIGCMLCLAACPSSSAEPATRAEAPPSRAAPAPQPAPPQPAPPQPVPPQPQAAASTAAFGSRGSQFVVHKVSEGKLALASSETDATRVLAAASGGLIQPQLGLLWFRDGEHLKVIDLEQLDAAPVTIAEGMPETDRFSITEHADVDTEDGCDLPWVELKWTAEPALESPITAAPKLRITNRDWLARARTRPLCAAGKQRALSTAKKHVRLPKKLLACEEAESCGGALPLGASGLELVLVRQQAGGDCADTACLLRDPKVRSFATPPRARSLGRPTRLRSVLADRIGSTARRPPTSWRISCAVPLAASRSMAAPWAGSSQVTRSASRAWATSTWRTNSAHLPLTAAPRRNREQRARLPAGDHPGARDARPQPGAARAR